MGRGFRVIATILLSLVVGGRAVAEGQHRYVAPLEGRAASRAVAAAGYIYVSTIRPTDAGRATTIQSQTADVVAQLKSTLEAAGSSMAQLCAVTITLNAAGDFDAMNAVYRAAFQHDALEITTSSSSVAPSSGLPTRTTIVSWTPAHTLIELSAVAVPVGAKRETMQPAKWASSSRPYSDIVVTDDLVFFSGLTSRRGEDDKPVSGSVKTQMTTILDNAGTLLETAGLSYEDIVSARVYVTSAFDFEAMNTTYAAYFPKDAPARGTAVVSLMADADAEVTFVASRQPKAVIGGAAANAIPVSVAVKSGPRMWLSGVIGDTDKHPRDIDGQTRDAFDRQKATLALAGMTLADVVDSTIYVHDYDDWPKVDGIFTQLFPMNPPASNATAARLVVDPALIEILLTAVHRQ